MHWGSNEETVMITEDGHTITAQIDGNYLSRSDLDDWMVSRIRYVEGQLGFEWTQRTESCRQSSGKWYCSDGDFRNYYLLVGEALHGCGSYCQYHS